MGNFLTFVLRNINPTEARVYSEVRVAYSDILVPEVHKKGSGEEGVS